MAYARSGQTKETEKRLQILRQQLYGKGVTDAVDSSKQTIHHPQNTYTIEADKVKLISKKAPAVDLSYLRFDLIKTVITGGLIIGIQLLLFYGLNKGLIRF